MTSSAACARAFRKLWNHGRCMLKSKTTTHAARAASSATRGSASCVTLRMSAGGSSCCSPRKSMLWCGVDAPYTQTYGDRASPPPSAASMAAVRAGQPRITPR